MPGLFAPIGDEAIQYISQRSIESTSIDDNSSHSGADARVTNNGGVSTESAGTESFSPSSQKNDKKSLHELQLEVLRSYRNDKNSLNFNQSRVSSRSTSNGINSGSSSKKRNSLQSFFGSSGKDSDATSKLNSTRRKSIIQPFFQQRTQLESDKQLQSDVQTSQKGQRLVKQSGLVMNDNDNTANPTTGLVNSHNKQGSESTTSHKAAEVSVTDSEDKKRTHVSSSTYTTQQPNSKITLQSIFLNLFTSSPLLTFTSLLTVLLAYNNNNFIALLVLLLSCFYSFYLVIF